MAWLNVGSVPAGLAWANVGNIQSNTLRLSYTFTGPLPTTLIEGHLRERYELNLFNSRWYRLYPKSPETEILVLQPTRDFEESIYQSRTIQIRKRLPDKGADWIVQVDQWL